MQVLFVGTEELDKYKVPGIGEFVRGTVKALSSELNQQKKSQITIFRNGLGKKFKNAEAFKILKSKGDLSDDEKKQLGKGVIGKINFI